MDDDQTGKVSFRNLKDAASEFPATDLTDEQIQEAIDAADNDGDGEINEEEFVAVMAGYRWV